MAITDPYKDDERVKAFKIGLGMNPSPSGITGMKTDSPLMPKGNTTPTGMPSIAQPKQAPLMQRLLPSNTIGGALIGSKVAPPQTMSGLQQQGGLSNALATLAAAIGPNSVGGNIGRGVLALNQNNFRNTMDVEGLNLERERMANELANMGLGRNIALANLGLRQDEAARKAKVFDTEQANELALKNNIADFGRIAGIYGGLSPDTLSRPLSDGTTVGQEIKSSLAELAPLSAQTAGLYKEMFPNPAQQKDSAYMDDRKYRDIVARQSQGMPITPEEQAWMKAYEKQKTLGPAAYGASRMNIMLATPQQVYDPNSGAFYFTTKGDVARNPGKYAGAETGIKSQSRNAMFNEIEASSQQLKEALADPSINFSQGQIAKFASVLRANDDGSTIANFLGTEVAKTLSPSEINYVTAVKNLRESAYALRQAGGASAQSSDMLRQAINSMVPGPRTPNKDYALSAMKRFDIQAQQLRGGVAQAGKGQGTPPRTGPKVGEVQKGYKFKGGNPADPKSWEKVQ